MDQERAGSIRRGLDWIFRDRTTGAITIAQWPNLPLWLFGGLTLAAWAAGQAETLGTWLSIGADLARAGGALAVVRRGVTPGRRCRGAATLVGLVALIAIRRAA